MRFDCLFVLAWRVPALAHHSAIAEYDLEKPVKVTGTVTRVEWSNPHIWFYVDVKNADGTVTNWGFSGGAPGVLQRRGISRDVDEARRRGRGRRASARRTDRPTARATR